MGQREAAMELSDAAALWSVGYLSAAGVVRTACDALVAGLDGAALGMLAAAPYTSADDEVPALLEPALNELGFAFHPWSSPSGLAAAVVAMSRRTLAGRVTPRELTSWAHRRVGHHQLPLAERLVDLDDVYGCIDYGDQTVEEIDTDVLAEARRIVEGAQDTPDGADGR